MTDFINSLNLELTIEFLRDNLLIILVPILIFILMFLKSFRKIIGYFLKNTLPLAFFVTLSALCSFFGYTIALNPFTLLVTLVLGLPGISLALFLALLI